MRRVACAFLLLLAVALAWAGPPAARAAGPTYLPAIGCTGYVYGNGVNAPINCTPASPTPTLPFVSVSSYGASGSTVSTTGSASSGTNTVTVASTTSFAVGQGVRVMQAGPSNTAAAVGITGVFVRGTPGTTTYLYQICSLGYNGSYSTCVSASTTTGPNAQIVNSLSYYGSTQNYVEVDIAQGANSSGYVIYRGINGSTPVLWSVGTGSVWKDQGLGWTDNGTQTGNWTGPTYLPSTYPTSASADWFVGTITAINGNTFTLTQDITGQPATFSNTVSGVAVYHDDTAAFNAAAAANVTSGANIQVPCGSYNVSYTISTTANYVGYSGQGMCSTILAIGTGYDFSFPNSNVSAQQRGNFVQNMYIVDRQKTTGFIVNATNTFNLNLNNLTVDLSPYGFNFLNNNLINLTNVIGNSTTRGYGSAWMRFASDSTNYMCCVNAFNVYAHGNAVYTGTANSIGGTDKNGYVIDGNAATFFTDFMAVSNTEGNGFLILNDTSNSTSPYYLTFYQASCEFPTARCVSISGPGGIAGPGDVYFTDTTITGSLNGNANFVTDSTTARITFKGGKSANATCRGFDISGTQTTITGAIIGNNSFGSNGSCDGVTVEAAARGVVIVGNEIGDPYNATVQRYPVAIVNGADNFVLTGNTFYGNVTNCQTYGGTTGTSRVIANNSGSC